MRTLLVITCFFLFSLSAFAQSEIRWYSIEEAFKLAGTEPRKIIIDVYTDWCGWCKVMDEKTYSNQVIAEYVNSRYYAVRFNAEQKEDVVLGGTTYKYVPNGTKGYNQLAAALLNGQLGYPSTVFLDEELKMIQPVQGYLEPKQFDEIIRFIGENHYKTTTWEKFSASYESPIAEIK